MSIPAQGAVGAETMTAGRDFFPERRGDWIQTYTGRRFWPLDPRPEDVAIEDIAHALALQTRFGGHCLRFYSVAEHCVHLARSASPEAALWLLLHDGSEAYLSDMVRPLKRHMPEYRAAEDRVAWVVYEAFDLDPGMEPAEVKERDCRILIDERAQVMLATGETWNYGGATERLGVTLQFWTPEQAEHEFLAAFTELTGRPVTLPALASPRADSDERTAGSVRAVCDANGRRWRVEGPGWTMQPEGTLTAAEAESICKASASVFATPAQPAGAVPDSLRALSEAAGPGKFKVVRGLHDYAVVAEVSDRKGSLNSVDADFAAASANFVRSLLASHPAGQSAGSGAEIDVDVRYVAQFVHRAMQIAVEAVNFEEGRRFPPLEDECGQWWGLAESFVSSIKEDAKPAPVSPLTGPVGTGWVLVPAEPTPAMLRAGQQQFRHYCFRHMEGHPAVWESMIAARPAAPEAQGLERVRHVKRVTEYEVLGEAEAQIATQDYQSAKVCGEGRRILREGDKLTVYRGSDSKLWCRFTDEFRDGRFVPAPPASSGQEG